MDTKVSIVIPVYNVEKTIDRCLKSITQQTIQPLEIILVDDGSTDNSGTLCELWAQKCPMIKVVHKSNEGLGYARNTGIEKASGDCIVFLDSDDYYKETLIENLVKGTSPEVDTVISGYIRVSEDGTEQFQYGYSETVYSGKSVTEEFLCRMMGSLPNQKDAIDMGATHVMYDLSIILDRNIRFPSERDLISEDIIFNIQYYQFSKGVKVIPDCDYYYVITDGSLTHKYRADRFEKSLALYHKEAELLNQYNMPAEAYVRLKKSFFNMIRMCMAQESHKINHLGFKSRYGAVRSICKNNEVNKIICSYPIAELGRTQRIFLNMIKRRMTLFLLLSVELGIISV